jgi:hypothetical protein
MVVAHIALNAGGGRLGRHLRGVQAQTFGHGIANGLEHLAFNAGTRVDLGGPHQQVDVLGEPFGCP